MDYLIYSRQLNSFSFHYQKEKTAYVTDDTKTRILIGRLYYSLVHYYFSEYPTLAASTGSGKHETLLRKINTEKSSNEYILFKTLKSLREWGDYHPLNIAPMDINMTRLFHQVNRIVNPS